MYAYANTWYIIIIEMFLILVLTFNFVRLGEPVMRI